MPPRNGEPLDVRKARLQAANQWDNFKAYRDSLKAVGKSNAEADRIAHAKYEHYGAEVSPEFPADPSTRPNELPLSAFNFDPEKDLSERDMFRWVIEFWK